MRYTLKLEDPPVASTSVVFCLGTHRPPEASKFLSLHPLFKLFLNKDLKHPDRIFAYTKCFLLLYPLNEEFVIVLPFCGSGHLSP